MEGLVLADATATNPQAIIALLGCLIGQVVHIIKKRTEDGKADDESEWQVFRKWVLARPINTLAASLVSWGAAVAMLHQIGPTSITVMLVNSIIVGGFGNSMVNRPGDKG